MVMTKAAAGYSLLIMVVIGVAAACDKVPLVAPVASTISISAAEIALPAGGSTAVAAYVVEEAGTLVQDGTTVYFTATLGSVEPAMATTRAGVAQTTFTAGNTPGNAQVVASSGGAEPAAGQGNTVQIVISSGP
jgi:hypothetical protein